MMRVVCYLFVLVFSSHALAQPACNTIQNGKKRLDCYDRLSPVARPEQKPPAPPVIVTNDMRAYRDRIDKAILETGANIAIGIETERRKTTLSEIQYPSLLFLGYMDRATVYVIATKFLNSFADARRIEFKSIEFLSKGGDGNYVFDLQKPSPVCDRDLCF